MSRNMDLSKEVMDLVRSQPGETSMYYAKIMDYKQSAISACMHQLCLQKRVSRSKKFSPLSGRLVWVYTLPTQVLTPDVQLAVHKAAPELKTRFVAKAQSLSLLGLIKAFFSGRKLYTLQKRPEQQTAPDTRSKLFCPRKGQRKEGARIVANFVSTVPVGRQFTIQDVYSVYRVSNVTYDPGSIWQGLHDCMEAGQLRRIKKGVYQKIV